MFAKGIDGAIEELKGKGLNRYVTQCRRSSNLKWTAKDGRVTCELRTFNLHVTSVGELLLFIETLQDFVGENTLIYVVKEPEELSIIVKNDENLTCTCSLTSCTWCHEKNTRKTSSASTKRLNTVHAMMTKKKRRV